MTALVAAIDALFADPNLAVDAVWRAGEPQAVRVVWRTPDQVTAFGSGRFVTTSRLLDVCTRIGPQGSCGDPLPAVGPKF